MEGMIVVQFAPIGMEGVRDLWFVIRIQHQCTRPAAMTLKEAR
jgi:hypothetical protein